MSARKPAETIGAGLEPLAVLPVFLLLRGRRAVVAGGDAGALWKARLLSAAGAEVHVVSRSIDRELGIEPVDGAILLHERDWRPDDLDGAAFAVAALPDEDDAAAFVAAARSRGVPVNAVDRPQLCDVQFGAIVNRSPLVVGVSTGGAAPVLAQRVRSEIESLLPRGLAAWVAAALRWRERVGGELPFGLPRRRFWERFTDHAFREPQSEPGTATLDDLLAAEKGGGGRGGSVALVGAGPGDPELLTLKAVRALRCADVILYDDLVADEILSYARREARTMLVGKTGGKASCRQDEINDLLVRLARGGRRVVRLKGGDPLVFARAAEELEACRQAGVPVEIVPGISAVQGAAAALGAPLTHRDGARRAQLVTAHDRRGELPDLDWGALADPTATTAVYMPRRRLREILGRALAAGLPPSTPAAAVVNATRPGQEVVLGTAADLQDRLADRATAGPVVVLVGQVLAGARATSEAVGAGAPPRTPDPSRSADDRRHAS